MLNSYEDLFENFNCLIIKTFEWLKFDHIFISSYELQFLFVFNFFVPKAFFLTTIHGLLFIWTLWVFLLELPI
jgi:hypothetical protein